MAILKKYDSTEKKSKLEGTIPSGWESGDTKNEMMIVEPLIAHPEIAGLYRAIDPETGWRGWVEYTPPLPDPTQTPGEISKEREFEILENKIAKAKRLVDLGILTSEEADLATLQAQAKTLWQELNSKA